MRSIICKGISGRSILIDVTHMEDLCDWIIELQKEDMPEVTLDDYLIATTVTDSKMRRIQLSDKPDDLNNLFTSSDTITLRIMLKSWTMAHNYDFKTMTADCPITLEKCKNPIASNCCMVAFERESFEKCDVCPQCRTTLK